jgi:hypothetical protein
MPIQPVEENEEGVLFRDSDDPRQVNELYDWMLRRYFPDEVDRLRGDADKIGFHKIVFYADDLPEVEYSTWNET